MQRKTLEEILEAVQGVSKKGTRYSIADDHRVSFYVGDSTSTLAVRQVSEVQLHNAFVEAFCRDAGENFYVPYDVVIGVACKPPKVEGARRTGFS